MSTQPNEPDPRWEWAVITSGDGRLSRMVRVQCNHLEVVPVRAGGEVVASLCLTCDTQLPPSAALRDTDDES